MRIIKDWIYPGYKLKRLFGFDRYDIVKTGVSRFEYGDLTGRMLNMNFIAFCQFMEKEKPLEVVDYRWHDENEIPDESAKVDDKFVDEWCENK